jgi:calcium-dependent protein kinase
MFLQGDVDKDGYLDYQEFVAISVHLKKMGDNDEHLHKSFEFFDRNQSGYIEIEELRDALADDVETSSEEVINSIMHDVDTDKVGRIVLTNNFVISFYLFTLFYAK